MDINEIKLKWRLKENNKEANINLWDEKADYFGDYTIPTVNDDKFIKYLKDENLIKSELHPGS